MTDPPMFPPPDQSESDALDEVVEAVLVQAPEIATLDGPRAEVWASDILALAAERIGGADPVGALVAALDRIGDARSVVGLCALGAFVDGVAPVGGPRPAWAAAIGTSACERAWVLERGRATSAAFAFVDAFDVRHVVTVDLVPGPPEIVGEVAVGPGDLLDALTEDDAGIEATEAEPAPLAGRVAAALAATEAPRESAVVNGHLLVARLAGLTDHVPAAPRPAADVVPDVVVRDPADDAHALQILTRALGIDPGASLAVGADGEAVDAVVLAVAPDDLIDHTPAERDAVLALEWADWLGAVIGLVRAGAGAVVDGDALVDHVNRCPEVTSSIPKRDRPRIAWAFETLTRPWSELGLVADGRLTERGAEVLPVALRRAWAPRSAE